MILNVGRLIAGGSRVASFNPLSLSPYGWYDPSDLSTLWKDTAGTSPVTADGDLVARIDDKSGHGYHLTQSTSSKRPLYKTNGALRWLEFDGVDDMLGNSSFSYSGTTLYVAVAHNVSATPVGAGRLVAFSNSLGQDYTSTDVCAAVIRRSGTMWSAYRNAFKASVTVNLSVTSLIESWFDGTDHKIRSNGGSVTSSASTGSFSPTWLTIFNYANDAGEPCGGAFYGLVVCTANPNSSDLRTWLGAKAGLTL